jgi:multidrug resistance efflux pump
MWNDSKTQTDITVERARAELSAAHGNQATVEQQIDAGGFCCEHHEKAALSAAKKEVKRWSQWLADRQVLEGGTQVSLFD